MIVPACSPCGAAVEWLRSCYQSRWALFADRPDVHTSGRYYFAEEGVPFVAGQHIFGSSEWLDKNWGHAQGLGEIINSSRSWDNGQPPAVMPGVDTIGRPNCLEQGERFSDGIPSATLIAGFPPQCLRTQPVVSKSFDAASAFGSCAVQLMSTQILNWSYDFKQLEITTYLQAFLGPAWAVGWEAPTLTLPAITWAISARGTLVWVDGTANYQQFALQAAYSLLQPSDQGSFSTSRFWYDAALYIHSVIRAAGAGAALPVFLCGHSYGGIAALALAAIYRMAQPAREIRFLTFGCPHIGDRRFVDTLRSCAGMAIGNDDDIVTAVPFNGDLIYEAASLFIDPRLLGWLAWRSPPRKFMLTVTGQLEPDLEAILDWLTLITLVGKIEAGLDFPYIEPHTVLQYQKRTIERCPFAEWPLTVNDYVRLFGEYIIGTEGGDEIITEGGDPIAYES